ncbi:MAG: hypothetical protein ACJ8G7_25380 [Rhizobacter sp.]
MNQLHWAGAFKDGVWCLYLVAAFALPVHHIRPILQYMRGSAGIGDACVRSEALQCVWRLPALMFSIFVAPSLPLFLSIFLDLLGRIGRVLAMRSSQQRWQANQAKRGRVAPQPGPRRVASEAFVGHHSLPEAMS